MATVAKLLDASTLAISLPDFVTYLQAHLCAAQGRLNPLLTHSEALRIYGVEATDSLTPLGWWGLNTPLDPIRTVQGDGAGFSGWGGFSKLSGRGAVMLLNAEGRFATFASGWVWTYLAGYESGFPPSRRQVPRE